MVWACLRREEEYVGKRVNGGNEGKRRRPKRRWLDNIGNDLSDRERAVRVGGSATPG